jgi:hypothetical protein
MIKLEIFHGYSLAFDNGKQFAVGSEDRESDMIEHCEMVAEKQETNFVILRHNASAQSTGLASLNDSQVIG